MAIAFARARYVSRSTGGSAVRSAAYNGRAELRAEATGQLYYFRDRADLEHHEILLPEGADPALGNSASLWNKAEQAEKRKDSQLARELVLALPADREVSHEDRVELARSFAIEHFSSKGLAVQLDVHAPHAGPGETQPEGDAANWHAHLLVTTRRVEGSDLASHKARDLDPVVRQIGGRGVVTEGEVWGEAWRVHQDRWLTEHGLSVRVDANAALPSVHLGPVRLRGQDPAAATQAEELRTANEAAARDPAVVLAALTRNNATFSPRELDRYLAKHLPEDERATVAQAVLARPEVLALHDRDTGAAVGRYTTQEVREQERAALADAAAVAGARHHGAVSAAAREAAQAARTMRPDQLEAFEHATTAGGLKIIEGRAGTGKSYMASAARDAFEQDGLRVIGLAPTNAVAQDMAKDGFRETSTVHSALFARKNGRGPIWDQQTVLIADEAAMLDTHVIGALLAEARQAGAKVVLIGDDRQLASVERGGLYSEMRQRHGSAVIGVVERQQVGWQRQAAQDLSEGRFKAAVQAFDRHGAITWSENENASLAALVRQVAADTAADPRATRFVFAYTNAQGDALNTALRGVRRARGELGPDVRLDTQHGPADFATGDRVQFTGTTKRMGIYNGNVGTITALDAATGRVTARLDSGREVTWQASEFDSFKHGYAGTIYKGQGKTLDYTYLLHSHHWRAAASYVALTRQRHGAQVFAARDVAKDATQLARQMARGEVRAASVAWATADEVASSPQQRATTAKATAIAARAAAGAQPGTRPTRSVRGATALEAVAQRATVGRAVAARGHDAAEQGIQTADQRAKAAAWDFQVLPSLPSKLDRHRTRQTVQAAASELVAGIAGLGRTITTLPNRLAPMMIHKRAAALAQRAIAGRDAAERGIQAADQRAKAAAWDFQVLPSLPSKLDRHRTRQTVQAVAQEMLYRTENVMDEITYGIRDLAKDRLGDWRVAKRKRDGVAYLAHVTPIRERLLEDAINRYCEDKGIAHWERDRWASVAQERERLSKIVGQIPYRDLIALDQERAQRAREAEQAVFLRPSSSPGPGM